MERENKQQWVILQHVLDTMPLRLPGDLSRPDEKWRVGHRKGRTSRLLVTGQCLFSFLMQKTQRRDTCALANGFTCLVFHQFCYILSVCSQRSPRNVFQSGSVLYFELT